MFKKAKDLKPGDYYIREIDGAMFKVESCERDAELDNPLGWFRVRLENGASITLRSDQTVAFV